MKPGLSSGRPPPPASSRTTSPSPAGTIGFCGNTNFYIDDLTVEYWDGDSFEPDIEEHFELDSGYTEDEPAHDAAGNLTYDGLYKYKYDAWNRLTTVNYAYWLDADENLTSTCEVSAIWYDGLGRRISKSGNITPGGACFTYNYYHDGQSVVETRDGSGNVLKQYLWGTQYVDELCQIAINDDPEDREEGTSSNQCLCETFYYALQDANYNVLGIVDSDGNLAERYEYTPYGQRTVYKSAGDRQSGDIVLNSHEAHLHRP